MLVLFPLVVAAAVAAQSLSPSVLHAKRSAPPAGWSRVRRHAPDAVLPLRFGLTQPNIDMATLETLLNDVSHPDSPNYGKHWSPGRVASHFAPSNEAVHTVVSWIADSGIARDRVRVSSTKGWVLLNATVAEAEDLLKTEYHVYEHDSGTAHVACNEYHLPEHVVPHVELVTPTIDFNAVVRRSGSTSTSTHITVGQPGAGTVNPVFKSTISNIFSELEHCDTQTTPDCLRALYDFYYLGPFAASKNSYAIVEYTPQAYRGADLDMFFKNFSSGLVGSRPVLESIDGGVVQDVAESFSFNGESNLDLEYGMTLVTERQPVTLYQVGDLEEGASFNNLLDALDGAYCTYEGGDDPTQDGIYPDSDPSGYQGCVVFFLAFFPCSNEFAAAGNDCGTITPAHVISTSYGYNEADLSPFYTARQCAEYAKLGMQGVTVLYSSGDNGVAGNNGLCLTAPNDPATYNTSSPPVQSGSGQTFNPSFPSTCPFVTAVGATQVIPGKSVLNTTHGEEVEQACAQVIFSGGGFSNYFGVPDYQKGVVEDYIKNNLTPSPYPAGTYNTTGTSRVYPDISANGANYVIAVDGQFGLVYGTSASTPVVGAMLTMINDARLFVGKSPIGFINPMIYSPGFQGAFNDITKGTNPGCGTDGFSAVKGFDPVTGLGTPNFLELLKLWSLAP
ncbi:Subtilisin-like protein [Mycena sanguinolenta]|uniref:tripeptidyl-peptidase II n=1 Tax=Mycena sanguinolenta TaxID=230812 RepID=A0A8H6X573_9AGAR|nr:Subtilisin-like protein [Mycena sanguinolenta]